MLHCKSEFGLNPLTPASNPAVVLCEYIYIYLFIYLYLYIYIYTQRFAEV